MRHRNRAAAAIAAAAIVVLTGCSHTKAAAPTQSAASKLASYTMPATIDIELQGDAHQVSHKGPGTLTVLRLIDDERGLKVLTVGSSAPITDDRSGLIVQEAYVNLTDFRKDGPYKVTPADGGSGPHNGAYAIVYRNGADGKPTDAAKYETPVSGCDVTIDRLGDSGKVTCPQLKDSAQRVASLTMTWTGTGRHTNLTPSTGPPPTATKP